MKKRQQNIHSSNFACKRLCVELNRSAWNAALRNMQEADIRRRLWVLESRIVQWLGKGGCLILLCSLLCPSTSLVVSLHQLITYLTTDCRRKSKPLVEISLKTQNCFSTHRQFSCELKRVLITIATRWFHFISGQEGPRTLILDGQCLHLHVRTFSGARSSLCGDPIVHLPCVFLQWSVCD